MQASSKDAYAVYQFLRDTEWRKFKEWVAFERTPQRKLCLLRIVASLLHIAFDEAK